MVWFYCYAERQCTECHNVVCIVFIVILSVIMLNVGLFIFMLSVVMANVIAANSWLEFYTSQGAGILKTLY